MNPALPDPALPDPALPDMDRFYSREEFRRWYESQLKGRYERVDGRIVAMAPERGAHLRAKGSIYRALVRAIAAAGVPCEALPDGATVETGENDYEPDALVNSGPPMADDAVAAPNPVVVVEVLSPGTAATDTGGKLADYFRVPSIAHYLIVHPTRRTITHHRRTADGIDTRIIVDGSVMMDPRGSPSRPRRSTRRIRPGRVSAAIQVSRERSPPLHANPCSRTRSRAGPRR